MTISKKIRVAASYAGTNAAQIANKLGTSRAAFHKRLDTDKFSTVELEEIASKIGARFEYCFVFPDGTRI